MIETRTWILRQHPPVGDDFDTQRHAQLVTKTVESYDDLFNVDQRQDTTREWVVIRTEAYSVDAFCRTVLDEGAFHGTVTPGQPLVAIGYGTVVASSWHNWPEDETTGPCCTKSSKYQPKFAMGTRVLGLFPVATFAVTTVDALTTMVTFPGVPMTMSLGLFGLSGLTAYVGLFRASPQPPKAGDTIVVSAAAGAVGSIVAQLAKLEHGTRVIGIAGGPAKCQYLTDALKLDGAIDYKHSTRSVLEQLDELCPDGVDFYFDNVGGPLLDTILQRIRLHARVVICGAVSQYSQGRINSKDKQRVEGPSNYIRLAEQSASMSGFVLTHYLGSALLRGLPYMLMQYARGNLQLLEHVVQGVEHFPTCLEDLFAGKHIGRTIVKV